MQTKHISDCLSVEKIPSRPVGDKNAQKSIFNCSFALGVFLTSSPIYKKKAQTYLLPV